MTINNSHANITGGITNDILNILDITDYLYSFYEVQFQYQS